MDDNMDAEQIIATEFKKFGYDSTDEDNFDKLYDISQTYNLDTADLTNHWLAYALTNSELKVCRESVALFEKWLDDELNKSRKVVKSSAAITPSSAKFLTKDDIKRVLNDTGDGDEQLFQAYGTPQVKAHMKQSQSPRTPISNAAKKQFASGNVLISPSTFSPPTINSGVPQTPSTRYCNRTNAGVVELRFGNDENQVWSSSSQTLVPIQLMPGAESAITLTSTYKYMFQKLHDKAEALSDIIEELGDEICRSNNLSSTSETDGDCRPVVGRVCCDGEGRLNAQSLLLELSLQHEGQEMMLDVSAVSSYSLFPGQVIGVDGSMSKCVKENSRKVVRKMTARQIYSNVMPPPHPANIPQSMQIVVAAGPFTTSDTLTFEPWADLCTYLRDHNVQICIIVGPFVDIKHEEIEKGTLDVTFEELFLQQIKTIMSSVVGMNTSVVIVPSCRDAFHEPVYPTPPIPLPKSSRGEKLHVMPDPCVCCVGGLTVAVTSVDVLFHMNGEEINLNPAPSDRIQRSVSHLLSQRSFYPLYPPHPDVAISYEHHRLFAHLPITPHLLICPSDLRYFVKDVGACCCVNPGRLSKGQVGGTFARIQVSAGNNITNISEYISAEIIRI